MSSENADTQTVRLYLQRHGDWDPETTLLTPEGKAQVIRAARQHFKGINFTSAFSSGMPRANQTIETAAMVYHSALREAIRSSKFRAKTIREDVYFGYLFPENDQEIDKIWTFDALLEAIVLQEKSGRRPMLRTILSQWPSAEIIRWALRCTMTHIAEHLVELHRNTDTINILVGTHATAHFAALDPKVTPGIIKPGDVVQYNWEVTKGYATLESSRILKAPAT